MKVQILAAMLLAAACSGSSAPSNHANSTNNDSTAACAGCLLPGSGECVNGDSPSACGVGGETCQPCDSGFCAESGKCITPPECGPENCEGCCDVDGLCVDGDSHDECGRGGLACEHCSTDATCADGTCLRDCGPDTCAGCCAADGLCVPGDAEQACGRGGGGCANCELITSVCSDGLCVAPDCAATCSGCCVGSDCVVVATAEQCGSSGSACMACGDGRTCTTGACVVNPGGSWTITVTTGVVVSTDTAGESWDGFNGLPDPFVEVEVAGQSAATDVVDDSLAPAWNADVLTASARDLFDGLILRYFDSDVALNDTICEISISLNDADPAFDGGVVESHCPDQAGSFVRWRLTPQP